MSSTLSSARSSGAFEYSLFQLLDSVLAQEDDDSLLSLAYISASMLSIQNTTVVQLQERIAAKLNQPHHISGLITVTMNIVNVILSFLQDFFQ